LDDIEAIGSMFLACVASRSSSSAFVLARRRFAVDLTIFGTTGLLISMFRVFLAGFGAVALLALLAADLIPVNELHGSLREAIEVGGAVESSESDILDEVVRCKVGEGFRDLEFRRPMDPESVIGPAGPSGRSPVDLVMVK